MTKREEILTALHGTLGTATTNEIAEKTNTPPNTVHNTLQRMEMDGEVARTDGTHWYVR